jgi:hypothetical protein
MVSFVRGVGLLPEHFPCLYFDKQLIISYLRSFPNLLRNKPFYGRLPR